MNVYANLRTEAGVSNDTAFALGLITSALQMIFVMFSWVLTTYFGRRSIYVWGSAVNTVLLICLGIAASIGDPHAYSASMAQASLGLIISVLFTLGPAPASWVIIGETSAIRLRPLTTGMGRASYYIVEIPCIFLGSYMLNPTVGHIFLRILQGHLLTYCRVETLAESVATFGVPPVFFAWSRHTSTCLR